MYIDYYKLNVSIYYKYKEKKANDYFKAKNKQEYRLVQP